MAARDVVLIGVLLFVFSISFFILHFVTSTMTDSLTAVSTINESESAIDIFEGTQSMTERYDYLILSIFIGFILSLIITGWFIGGHPLFMFIYFIFIVISVILSTILSNVWESVSTEAIFGTTVASFVITNNIMGNLPIYMSIIGFIGMIVMFAKPYVMGDSM